MPRIDKPSQRRPGNRSGGGRPRKPGPRYENQRLKPEPPNPLIIAARAKLGIIGLGQQATPMEVIRAKQWLSNTELTVAALYISLYRGAGFREAKIEFKSASPFDRLIAERDSEPWEELIDFTTKEGVAKIPRKMLAAIWDGAFSPEVERYGDALARSSGPAPAPRQLSRRKENEAPETDTSQARAWKMWKAMQAALTADQRRVIDDLCIAENWPQWVVQRIHGRDEAPSDPQRKALIAGLRSMGAALWARRTAVPANDHQANDNAAPKASRAGPPLIETTAFVDEDGNLIREVVRIVSRRKGSGPEAA